MLLSICRTHYHRKLGFNNQTVGPKAIQISGDIQSTWKCEFFCEIFIGIYIKCNRFWMQTFWAIRNGRSFSVWIFSGPEYLKFRILCSKDKSQGSISTVLWYCFANKMLCTGRSYVWNEKLWNIIIVAIIFQTESVNR